MNTTEVPILQSEYQIKEIIQNVQIRLPKPGDPHLKSLPVPPFNPEFDPSETSAPTSLFRRGIFQGAALITVNYFNFTLDDFDGEFKTVKIRIVTAVKDEKLRWIVDVFNTHNASEAAYKLSFNMSPLDISKIKTEFVFIKDTGNDLSFGVRKIK